MRRLYRIPLRLFRGPGNQLPARLWRELFSGSVRGQLIWSVAVVHAIMMTLFVYDLSVRQENFLIESQLTQATSLANNLGLIAVTPLLSSDLGSLQELTQAIGGYPGVTQVMVIGTDGKILAHGRPELRGKYISDFDRFASAHGHLHILANDAAEADVVATVMLNEKRLGWVRLLVSRSDTASRLALIVETGLLYTTAAISIGILLAWLLANRLTRRLQEFARVADAVTAGDLERRATVTGHDELSRLGHAFNYMLLTLEMRARREAQLKAELQAEKDLAEVTLASIGDAVITSDKWGLVTYLNAAASRLTGLSRIQALGQPVAAVFSMRSAQQPHEEALQATTQPTSHSRQLPQASLPLDVFGEQAFLAQQGKLLTRQGEIIPVESISSPIRAHNGELLGSVMVARDISENQRIQERLQWQAEHDVLTGLPNRSLLERLFDAALWHSREAQKKLVVCLIDIDNFKTVNDAFGHAVGDKLLIDIVARLRKLLRECDIVARLGGDEFVLLLEDLDDIDAITGVVNKILDHLARPFEVDGIAISVTASIGLSIFPDDPSDADTLLRNADQAMYLAKQEGRNRSHLFDIGQAQERKSTRQILARFREALNRGELVLYYQPKVNMVTHEVSGFEALLRWQDPERGLIPPLQFLPKIENSDLVIELGEWVIHQALLQIALWQAQGLSWPVSVNISPRHFQHADFLVRLLRILARHPTVSPTMLEFEILESTALTDLGSMNHVIAECSKLGIRFSLDDFGTGYSSLSYLQRLAVQTIKIDQSFVRSMVNDPDNLALVESIIHIAKVFKLDIVAEGVETEREAIVLQNMGCEVIQGYGIARPMPALQCIGWANSYFRASHTHDIVAPASLLNVTTSQ
ncbi:diguanylate cyclase (GGDEF)-like protein/PAS domain S-box-containing protein [Herbaspirillum sp. Sphag1AN]|uniref:EAL domain-containing protein n=1 Tax=unclassified Herbaspirillum TaxID=2624150 RepID=UPI00161D7537|nr:MULTISPECIES: EAL domain-containing protein [unclassified Herbaspirillum]MBB3212331.1 diguanylate cyclase (GGDEF)-like protein/PAS domain S-box-containing protein [Herbaspirillum sp. Sphag1AN]MBB3245571.1 diguanylate cyclase (GGDEF)-like protein/PAS domain S-box-containing protein [Herbaspirillum sp. Sphag64]